MEAAGPSRKRSSREDDDDSSKHPAQKKVRFPKGKKVKTGDYVVDGQDDEDLPGWKDPRKVTKERARHRNQMTAELLDEENRGMLHDITRAEVQYDDNETFVDDGIQMEPFNLSKEREEGYFDADGNYVEYINENEIKDAWLDSIDANKNVAPRTHVAPDKEDDIQDLSSDDIGKIKRRIADALEPGETVLQALRRLKGTSNNKKEKMSSATKQLFDQLTEDAMKLMENGDYNVYDENQETFQREAEGYEKLAEARRQVTSIGSGSSEVNVAAEDTLDMFAEDEETAAVNLVSDSKELDPNGSSQLSENGYLQSDYVYDESSGYYYSSSLGYYYDPSSGLYCCAATGQWYSYNGESGTYDEVEQAASAVS